MSGRVVVPDSSVPIDLERGAFFSAAFALPFESCVPDLLYRLELEPFGGDQLVYLPTRITAGSRETPFGVKARQRRKCLNPRESARPPARAAW